MTIFALPPSNLGDDMIRPSTFGSFFHLFREVPLQRPKQVSGAAAAIVVRRWMTQSAQAMTSAEVSTALRPFIFIVHPDRFWNHPTEKIANEISLQKLNEFLGNQLDRNCSPKDETVTFYLRKNDHSNKISSPSSLKLVKIVLSSRETVNKTVHKYVAID